jgi:hypothetical protein
MSKEYLLSLNLIITFNQFLEKIIQKIFFPTATVAQNRRFSAFSPFALQCPKILTSGKSQP